MKSKIGKVLAVSTLVLAAVGCGQGINMGSLLLQGTKRNANEHPQKPDNAETPSIPHPTPPQTEPTVPPVPEPTPTLPPLPQLPLKICSRLSFDHVTWLPQLSPVDQEAFKLALNISGSFEGNHGWANITNNFDGMGLSLGLLNQNLGTGSLQPLLIKMRDRHFGILQYVFGPTRLAGLLGMLKRWEQERFLWGPSLFFSPLDEPDWRTGIIEKLAATPEQSSVQWAISTLYDGTRFKPEWLSDLTRMAMSPEYVSIQVETASKYHIRALSYENQIGVIELRSYLLMFDFVVQNGSIYNQDLQDYQAYLQATPQASADQKLNKILELRLRHVKPQYVEDVRRRKQSIIVGQGVVHGDLRKLESEYCYDGHYLYQ